MKFFAVVIMLAAWGSLFLRPGPGLRLLLFMVFGLLGAVLSLAGGFSYWWNSSMLPSEKSALILICGLLTLASQLGALISAVLAEQEWMDVPKSRRRH